MCSLNYIKPISCSECDTLQCIGFFLRRSSYQNGLSAVVFSGFDDQDWQDLYLPLKYKNLSQQLGNIIVVRDDIYLSVSVYVLFLLVRKVLYF